MNPQEQKDTPSGKPTDPQKTGEKELDKDKDKDKSVSGSEKKDDGSCSSC